MVQEYHHPTIWELNIVAIIYFYVARSIDWNYRLITLLFKKYGDLSLCLENYALLSLPQIFTHNYMCIH